MELVRRYGAANVADGRVSVGEGESEPGTLIFDSDSLRRASIIWKDSVARRGLASIRVSGSRTRWQTPQGLTLGQSLKTVERLNGRRFRLMGFDWDYSGTTESWLGGTLAKAEVAGCTLYARLDPDQEHVDLPLLAQVAGEREFSSGHPAMQASEARVYEMGLVWR